MISMAWLASCTAVPSTISSTISASSDSPTQSTGSLAQSFSVDLRYPSSATRDRMLPSIHADRIPLSHQIQGIPIHATTEASAAAVPADSSNSPQTITVVSTLTVTSLSVVTNLPPPMTPTSSKTLTFSYTYPCVWSDGLRAGMRKECLGSGTSVFTVLVETSCTVATTTLDWPYYYYSIAPTFSS